MYCEDSPGQGNGAAHASNPGYFRNMTKRPGRRNPVQARAMTVKAVAVRYWVPLTGEIDAMRIRARDSFDACQHESLLRNARLSWSYFPGRSPPIRTKIRHFALLVPQSRAWR